MIGCTRAEGGDWPVYRASIVDFATRNPKIKVAIVQSTSDSISKAYSTVQPFLDAQLDAFASVINEPDPELAYTLLAVSGELAAQAFSSPHL